MSPLVSILIPCYNSVDFVEETIASAFAQKYENIEVIVVDDGSTDGSYERLEQLRNSTYPSLQIHFHPGHQNKGVSATRQKALSQSKGDFIAFLDADDCMHEGKIQQQLNVFQEHSNVVLCHSLMDIIGGEENDADYFDHLFGFRPTEPYDYHKQKDFLIRNGVCCSSVLVKRSAIEGLIFSTAQLFQHEDWLCWSLIAPQGKYMFLNERLGRYRVHPASATAAVRANPLVAHYSKLELFLTLAVRSSSTYISFLAMGKVFRMIWLLLFFYGNLDGDKSSEKTAIKEAVELNKMPFYKTLLRIKRLKNRLMPS